LESDRSIDSEVKYMKLFLFLATLIAGCSSGSAQGTSPSADDTYCSPTEGPLTASQAKTVANASLCPPVGYTTGECITNFPHGSNGAGTSTTDAALEWGCSIATGGGS
jgi:hypothetical protein